MTEKEGSTVTHRHDIRINGRRVLILTPGKIEVEMQPDAKVGILTIKSSHTTVVSEQASPPHALSQTVLDLAIRSQNPKQADMTTTFVVPKGTHVQIRTRRHGDVKVSDSMAETKLVKITIDDESGPRAPRRRRPW